MARTALTVTQITDAGVALPAATNGTADGHLFANDITTILQLTNNGASTRVVTIQTGGQVAGKNIEDQSVSLAAGETKYVGGMQSSLYNRPSDPDRGKVYIDFPAGAQTEIAVRAFKV